MKKRTVQPIAHKRAIARVESYKKDLAKGKELQSEIIEQFASDITPFLTKKGTVRKNLSAKKTAEFNRLVGEFKKTTSYSKQKSQNKRKRTIETAEKRGTYTKQESKAILDAFTSQAIRDLSKKQILDSDQVVTLLREFRANGKTTKQEFEKVAKYLIETKENVPNEVSGLVTQDDTYKMAEELLKDLDKIIF